MKRFYLALVYLVLIFITLPVGDFVLKNNFMSFFLNFQLIKNMTFVYFNGKEKPIFSKDFFGFGRTGMLYQTRIGFGSDK